MNQLTEALIEFHQAFGHPVSEHKLEEDTDALRGFLELRKTLIREECEELCEALDLRDEENVIKEAADLLYVTVGTLVVLVGYAPVEEAFKAVHESNMSKLVNGKPVYREDGKIIKGPNYKAPDMKPFSPGKQWVGLSEADLEKLRNVIL